MGASGDQTQGSPKRLGDVLVPTDFSEPSLAAIEYARGLLERFEGQLHLIYVQEPTATYALPGLAEAPALVTLGELARHNRARLTQLCTQYVGSEATPPCHAPTGRAFDEICQVAREIPAQLIVIATRGLTGVRHLLLGSTAERVVRHAPCPVLIVRGTALKARGGPVQLRRILVPVDFSASSRASVEYAIRFATAIDATVVLMNAIQVLPFIPTEQVARSDQMPAAGVIERAARMQLKKFVAEIDFAGVRHEAVVRCGRPPDEICDFAEGTGADLIVISTHGHSGLAHVLIGSVAEHVVRYARAPVLVVPQGERPAGPR